MLSRGGMIRQGKMSVADRKEIDGKGRQDEMVESNWDTS